MPDRRACLVLAALAVVPAAFFGSALLVGKTLCHDDLTFWFYPWKVLLYRLACEGRVSLWLSGEFAGMPHLADIQRQLLYPPNIVFYLLPTHVAMVVFVAMHFALAGWGMYLWLRSFPLEVCPGHVAAAAGGTVFAFSAFPVLHLSQLPVLASYAWIPWGLTYIERYARDGRSWHILGLSFSAALLVLGGSPQVAYIGGSLQLLLALSLLARSSGEVVETARRFAVLVLAAGLAVGICAAQLLPTIELALMSSRRDVPLEYSSIGTAPLAMLVTFLHPYLRGNPREGTWVGTPYGYHEECFYAGLLTLVLATSGLAAARRVPRRVSFLVAITFLGAITALGNGVTLLGHPLHDAMVDLVPLFGRFRVPARWMIWTVVGLAALSALGAEQLMRYRGPRERRTAESWLPCLLGMLACTSLAWLLARFSVLSPEHPAEAPWAYAQLLVALGACLGTRLGQHRAVWVTLGLLYLQGFDLVRQAGRYIQPVPVEQVARAAAVLERFSNQPKPYRVMTHTSAEIPTEVATWSPAAGVANVQGTNPLFLEPYLEYIYFSQAGHLPFSSDVKGLMHHNGFFIMEPHESPMTRLLDLRFLITGPQAAGRRPPLPAANLSGGDTVGNLTIRRPKLSPYSHVLAVHDYQVEPDHEVRLHRLYLGNVDPTTTVLLKRPPPRVPAGPPGRPRGQVTLLSYTDDRIEIGTSLDRDSFVVLSEVCYPGWEATVDGRPAEILEANDIFRAVQVPAGQHRIRMRFAPWSLRVGLAISFLTLLGLGGSAFNAWRQRRHAA